MCAKKPLLYGTWAKHEEPIATPATTRATNLPARLTASLRVSIDAKTLLGLVGSCLVKLNILAATAPDCATAALPIR
jgi:hypothetical protein